MLGSRTYNGGAKGPAVPPSWEPPPNSQANTCQVSAGIGGMQRTRPGPHLGAGGRVVGEVKLAPIGRVGAERSPGRGANTGQGPGWGGTLCGRNWNNCVSEAQSKEGIEAMLKQVITRTIETIVYQRRANVKMSETSTLVPFLLQVHITALHLDFRAWEVSLKNCKILALAGMAQLVRCHPVHRGLLV